MILYFYFHFHRFICNKNSDNTRFGELFHQNDIGITSFFKTIMKSECKKPSRLPNYYNSANYTLSNT